jgi:protein-disulfide isomerase
LLIVLSFVFALIATIAVTIVIVGKKGDVKVTKNASVSNSEIEQVVKDYLTNNPEIIVQSFMVAKQKEQELAEQESSKNVKNFIKDLTSDKNSPVFGNPKGKSVIIEYSDYRCGFCRKAAPDIKKLVQENKDLKVIVKSYPILGEESVNLAKVALAVYKLSPDKFEEFNDGIYEKGISSVSGAIALANEIGVSGKKLEEEISKPLYQDIINKNLEIGQKIGINGTPAFIINGALMRGAIGYSAMQAALNSK